MSLLEYDIQKSQYRRWANVGPNYISSSMTSTEYVMNAI